MSKHTAGPWVYANSGLIDCVFAENLPLGDSRLAETIGPNSEANARLIAAAPAMYEALNKLYEKVRFYRHFDNAEGEELLDKCRSALAQAEGRQ